MTKVMDTWQEDTEELRRQFETLTGKDSIRADRAIRSIGEWMTSDLFMSQRAAIREHIHPTKSDLDDARRANLYRLLLDSFYQAIPFGTGGRRGRVGFGPNRINEATVAMSVQGHCNFLKERFQDEDELFVVIAFDVRVFNDVSSTYFFLPDGENPLLGLTSRKLARCAAEIYAGNGIRCYYPSPKTDDAYLSTPELSFLIRSLGASGGINVSASHNHPDDNGFKFFNEEGAQDVPPADEELAAYMESDHISGIQRLPFDNALKEGLVQDIPEQRHQEYINTNLNLDRGPAENLAPPTRPIVYTPLCGTGKTTVTPTLQSAGYQVVEHAPQATYDGSFSSVPFLLPNPEVEEAHRPAIATAEECGAAVVFSTDPDADRLGILVRNEDNANPGWVHLNGNEIGCILAYYLTLDKRLGPCRRGLIVTTLVTTSMVKEIAERAGVQIVSNLRVGFKFIANVLKKLETTGQYEDIAAKADDLVLATEESHGFLLTPCIRDKDAAGAALILTDLDAKLHQEGRSLLGYLDEIAAECGNYGSAIRAILMRGMQGSDALKDLMASLRNNPPERVGSWPIDSVDDYLDGSDITKDPNWPAVEVATSMDKANNLLVLNSGAARAIIRPSGTEPKMKIYAEAQAPGGSRAQAKEKALEFATAMYQICLERMLPDSQLSPAAGRIPDHVDLTLKQRFDTAFTPNFLKPKTLQTLASCDAPGKLAWLRENLSDYGDGDDPLRTMIKPLLTLCTTAKAELDDPGQACINAVTNALEGYAGNANGAAA